MYDANNKPTVYVNMLGEFSITMNGKRIDDHNNQSKKPWSLLEYLITFRKRDISPTELIELIWSDDSSSNPNGALKTLLFRVRKLLTGLDFPPKDLIVQRRGSYAWNSDILTIVDIDLFEDSANRLLSTKFSKDISLTACLEAIDLYKGDFLPKSNFESWVIPISTYYHSLYQSLVHKTLDLLSQAGEHQQITEVCQKAITIEPFDEGFHYHLIQALFLSDNQKGALEHYAHATDLFYNEFAITPSEHFKSLYKIIQDKSHGITTDLTTIQEILAEESRHDGAYCCEYSVFKDFYQLEVRSIERTGDSIYLCMLTVTSTDGQLLKPTLQAKVMSELGDSIRTSLRQGDIYTRSNICQYLIILPTSSYENGAHVLSRIIRNFKKRYARKNVSIHYSLQAFANHS